MISNGGIGTHSQTMRRARTLRQSSVSCKRRPLWDLRARRIGSRSCRRLIRFRLASRTKWHVPPRSLFESVATVEANVLEQGAFLPFHRLLMHAHEKFLQEECGYDGTQPYVTHLAPFCFSRKMLTGAATGTSPVRPGISPPRTSSTQRPALAATA